MDAMARSGGVCEFCGAGEGVAAVTVRAETCMVADAWATALLVLGPERGMQVAAAQGIEALFMDADRR